MLTHAKIINGYFLKSKANAQKIFNNTLSFNTSKSVKYFCKQINREKEDDRFDYTKFYNDSSLAKEKANQRKQIEKNALSMKEDYAISENITFDNLAELGIDETVQGNLSEKFDSTLYKIQVENQIKVLSDALNPDQNTETSMIHYNYNSHTERDISVLIANYQLKEKRGDTLFSQEKLNIADLYCDTAIRSLRIHKSLTEQCVNKITMVESYDNFPFLAPINFALNEIDDDKIQYINKQDTLRNVPDKPDHIFEAINQNIVDVMWEKSLIDPDTKYDLIEVDTKGSALNVIDPLIDCLAPNGIIGLNFTDMRSSMASFDQKKLIYFYNSTKQKKVFENYDFFLRCIINALNKRLAMYNKEIEPVLSYSGSFYLKAYFRLKEKASIEEYKDESYVASCSYCPYFTMDFQDSNKQKIDFFTMETLPNVSNLKNYCPQCNNTMEIYGPIYNKNICDNQFINGLQGTFYDLQTTSNLEDHFVNSGKLESLLSTFEQEADVKKRTSSYAIDLADLNSFFGINFPKIEVIQNVIANLGFKSSKSHYGHSTQITDAPVDVFFDQLRVMHRMKIQRNPEAATKFKLKEDRVELLRILSKSLKFHIKLKLQEESLGSLFVPWDRSNTTDKKNRKKVGQKKLNSKTRFIDDAN